jgi:hypothetical protein
MNAIPKRCRSCRPDDKPEPEPDHIYHASYYSVTHGMGASVI